MISNVSRTAARRLSSHAIAKPATPAVSGVTTLANGVRVSADHNNQGTVSLNIWVDAGSRNDAAEAHGTAHFVEHMAFKGTSKRNQKQLESEIQALGGQFSVHTGREKTVYSANVFGKDAAKAFEILADAAVNSTYENADKERDALLAKVADLKESYNVLDHLHETAFMGTSLGRSVHGTEESVRKITRDHLVGFAKGNYSGSKLVVTAAGDIDQQKLVDLTEKNLGHVAASSSSAQPDAAIFVGSDKRIRFDSMPAADIALAFNGACHNSEFVYPLEVMRAVLGNWDKSGVVGRNAASKFAQACADFELANSYYTINKNYKDAGLFGVVMNVPDNKQNDIMWYVLDSMVRLAHNVTEEEVVRAKAQLKADLLAQTATNSQIAGKAGKQLLAYGRRLSLDEMIARVDAVSVEDVNVTANKFINDEDHALAAVGPIFELPDYNWIRRRSYWTRY